MPDCGQVPAAAGQALVATEPAREAAAPAARAQPSRVAKAATYLWPAGPAVPQSPPIAAAFADQAAGVPLFKAHCSYLL